MCTKSIFCIVILMFVCVFLIFGASIDSRAVRAVKMQFRATTSSNTIKIPATNVASKADSKPSVSHWQRAIKDVVSGNVAKRNLRHSWQIRDKQNFLNAFANRQATFNGTTKANAIGLNLDSLDKTRIAYSNSFENSMSKNVRNQRSTTDAPRWKRDTNRAVPGNFEWKRFPTSNGRKENVYGRLRRQSEDGVFNGTDIIAAAWQQAVEETIGNATDSMAPETNPDQCGTNVNSSPAQTPTVLKFPYPLSDQSLPPAQNNDTFQNPLDTQTSHVGTQFSCPAANSLNLQNSMVPSIPSANGATDVANASIALPAAWHKAVQEAMPDGNINSFTSIPAWLEELISDPPSTTVTPAPFQNKVSPNTFNNKQQTDNTNSFDIVGTTCAPWDKTTESTTLTSFAPTDHFNSQCNTNENRLPLSKGDARSKSTMMAMMALKMAESAKAAQGPAGMEANERVKLLLANRADQAASTAQAALDNAASIVKMFERELSAARRMLEYQEAEQRKSTEKGERANDLLLHAKAQLNAVKSSMCGAETMVESAKSAVEGAKMFFKAKAMEFYVLTNHTRLLKCALRKACQELKQELKITYKFLGHLDEMVKSQRLEMEQMCDFGDNTDGHKEEEEVERKDECNTDIEDQEKKEEHEDQDKNVGDCGQGQEDQDKPDYNCDDHDRDEQGTNEYNCNDDRKDQDKKVDDCNQDRSEQDKNYDDCDDEREEQEKKDNCDNNSTNQDKKYKVCSFDREDQSKKGDECDHDQEEQNKKYENCDHDGEEQDKDQEIGECDHDREEQNKKYDNCDHDREEQNKKYENCNHDGEDQDKGQEIGECDHDREEQNKIYENCNHDREDQDDTKVNKCDFDREEQNKKCDDSDGGREDQVQKDDNCDHDREDQDEKVNNSDFDSEEQTKNCDDSDGGREDQVQKDDNCNHDREDQDEKVNNCDFDREEQNKKCDDSDGGREDQVQKDDNCNHDREDQDEKVNNCDFDREEQNKKCDDSDGGREDQVQKDDNCNHDREDQDEKVDNCDRKSQNKKGDQCQNDYEEPEMEDDDDREEDVVDANSMCRGKGRKQHKLGKKMKYKFEITAEKGRVREQKAINAASSGDRGSTMFSLQNIADNMSSLGERFQSNVEAGASAITRTVRHMHTSLTTFLLIFFGTSLAVAVYLFSCGNGCRVLW